MSSLGPLAARLFNKPVALHPGQADLAMTALADYFAGARANGLMSFYGSEVEEEVERYTPYEVVERVAIIPVRGTLIQRTGWLPLSWCALLGVTGYDAIRLALMDALSNAKIDAIVLDIDSPGGECAGMLDLADTIYAGRRVKPIWSILGENAFSAAYCIGSAATKLIVPRTGGTGSIGVIYMHVAMERALDKAGLDVTLITKGDLKGDGSDVKALSNGAYRRMKSDVLAVGDLFDQTVARNRDMKVSEVFDTQAGTFLGGKGVDVGLADAVMAPDAAFRALLKELG